jgi:hypothetical protein
MFKKEENSTPIWVVDLVYMSEELNYTMSFCFSLVSGPTYSATSFLSGLLVVDFF